MGLRTAIQQAWAGKWSAAADMLFIDEEDIAEATDTDRRIDAFNQEASKRGIREIGYTAFPQLVEQNSPSEAFVEGAKEGLEQMSNSIADATGKGIWESVKALKWVIITAAILFGVYLWGKKRL